MYLKRHNELKVLGLYLGDYAKQIYLREISRLARLPLKNTQNVLNALEKSRILKSARSGKNKYFSLNLDNVQTKLYLLQSEIDKTLLFLEAYPQFKTFLKEVSKVAIIAFGSFAKFAAGKESDLDLLILSEAEEKLPLHLVPCKIHDVRMSEASFIKAVKKKETLMKEIEENHVILNNHSFYIDIMWGQYGS